MESRKRPISSSIVAVVRLLCFFSGIASGRAIYFWMTQHLCTHARISWSGFSPVHGPSALAALMPELMKGFVSTGLTYSGPEEGSR